MAELDFDLLVGQYYAGLYRFAVSLTASESEAWDLTQQTFLLFATKGHQLRDATKAKAWLFTTLHREFLGKERRTLRFPHFEMEAVAAELPPQLPRDYSGVDITVLLEALSQMDETFRAAVSLYYLEDYSYNEIATVLDIPLGTVKSRIARGVAQLQRSLVDPVSTSHPTTQAHHG